MSAENTSFALTATQKRLKLVVIALGALIVLALGALIGGLIIRLAGGAPASERPYVSEIAIDGDATVMGAELNDRRLALKLKTPEGDEVIIVDATSGRELGRVRIVRKP
ncbi:MAG: hypothetical protein ACT4OG_08875 [Alphaproteobacteria bacterium]